MTCYDADLNDLFESHLDSFFGMSDSALKSVIKYAFMNGKRIRPKITMDIYHSLTNCTKECGISVLAIEYIHTASLLIDDLPCMDNAYERRNQKCVHIKYGEAVTQLASIALISMGINAIAKLPPFLIESFSHMISDACEGQLLDLTCPDDIKQIIQKKTGKFFELSFVLGWILGGGDFDKIDEIKIIANNFSMAFQILDDIKDMEEDNTNNYAIKYGLDKAIADANQYLNAYKNGLIKYNLYSDFFKYLDKHPTNLFSVFIRNKT